MAEAEVGADVAADVLHEVVAVLEEAAKFVLIDGRGRWPFPFGGFAARVSGAGGGPMDERDLSFDEDEEDAMALGFALMLMFDEVEGAVGVRK